MHPSTVPPCPGPARPPRRASWTLRAALAAACCVGLFGAPTRAGIAPGIPEAPAILAYCAAAQRSVRRALDSVPSEPASGREAIEEGAADVWEALRLTVISDWPESLEGPRKRIQRWLEASAAALAKAGRIGDERVAAKRRPLKLASERLAGTIRTLYRLAPVDLPPSLLPPGSPAPPEEPPPLPDDPPAPPGVESFPLLIPGEGFTGPPPDAAASGEGPGSDAQAIARWDVVPWQTFRGLFTVGVVAFHIGGIDRVEFSVEGGPWTAVREMSRNPTTGVWEYTALLDARLLRDGLVEVRAVVHPSAGISRVLAGPHDQSLAALVRGEHSLFLSANAQGRLAEPVRWVSPSGSDAWNNGSQLRPFATIRRAVLDVVARHGEADGATVVLTEGNHAYPVLPDRVPTSRRWLTLRAAPGLPAQRVRITSGPGEGAPGLHTKLVRLNGLTVRGVTLADGDREGAARAWVDGCVLEGSGPLDATRFFSAEAWTGGIYVTDSVLRNVKYPVYLQTLTRNTLITDVGGDAIREPAGLVANCEVRRIVNLDDTHNDVLQFWDPRPRPRFENIIVYGLRAVADIDAQALFVQEYGDEILYRDFAFVNYLTYARIGAQWQNPGTHVLFWNVDILSPPDALEVNRGGLLIADVDGRATRVHNLSLRSSVLQRFNLSISGEEPAADGLGWAEDNHFVDVTSHLALAPGVGVTTGADVSSLFLDPAGGDFAPAPFSPLLGRVAEPLVPADVDGRPRAAPDAIGAVGGAR